MAYVGQGIKGGTFSVLDTSGNTYNGSNVTFNLGTQVSSPAQLLVSHDGVIQKPVTDYVLATGGTQITFTTAPASGASIFITEISGAVGAPMNRDINGDELILDADADTSITADTDDQIDIRVAGTDQITIKDGALSPVTDNDIDLGTSSLEFKDGYFDGTLHCDVIDLAGTEYTSISTTIGALADVSMDITNFVNSLLIQTNRDGSAPSTGTLNAATDNVGIGNAVFASLTEADNCVAVGAFALDAITTGGNNVALGYLAGSGQVTGEGNTYLGHGSGFSSTSGDHNIHIGVESGRYVTGSDNICIGHDSGLTGSPGGQITSGSNIIALGDENIGNCHIQTDWTVASDQRDKTDFTPLDIGLDFVNALKPYTYKWDKRSKYGYKYAADYELNDQTPDGTHKEDWLDIGFKAQEVEALEEAAGYKIADKTNLTTTLTEDKKQYGIKYSNFVPILVKAVQELLAKNNALEARVKTLEDA